MSEDTITAIATPIGIGAISVIRISGPLSISSANSIFIGKRNLLNVESHTIHYGKILDKSEQVIDDCLVTVFKSPHSYTGEDSVEISTHGNPLIAEKIVESLLNQNIRIAEPGEFTKRAFLNGRIDLAQAEAVIDVITSRSTAALNGARNQLNGILSQRVAFLRQELLNISSYIELELDFAEEDVEFLKRDELTQKINDVINELKTILATFRFGKINRDGINVAIIGEPNVGKSSLLNYVVKESRALVSEIPGTTRDVIKEEVSIDGTSYRFIDTAGLRKSEDPIEIEGMKLSRKSIQSADVVLFISDKPVLDDSFNEQELDLKSNRVLRVLNKIDLSRPNKHNFDVLVSAKTGEGMSDLFIKLRDLVFGSEIFTEKSTIVSNIRHQHCLIRSKESLESAIHAIEIKSSGEFLTQHINEAILSLSEIIGVVTTDDILNNIFSKFCIGK